MRSKLTFSKRSIASAVLASSLISASAWAATTKISGEIKGASGGSYTVQLVSKAGKILKQAVIPSNGKFALSQIKASALKQSSLQVTKGGQYFGPIVLSTTTKSDEIFFSGVTPSSKAGIALGAITLKSGYGVVKKMPSTSLIDSADKAVAKRGAPIGAGKLGYVAAKSKAAGLAGQDDDHDGIINVYDVDRDGDLLANAFDVGTAQSSSSFVKKVLPRAGESGQSRFDSPFTTLYDPISESLNLNIGTVTQAQIDSGILNHFAIVYFFRAPSTYTGAHVVCDSSLAYCRSAADGGSTSTVGGVSESPAPLGITWSAYNADGSGFPNFQLISDFHGDGNVFVGSVNPGVGTSGIRPGDVATIEFMTGATVSESRPISIPSYFVTVPAMKTFNVGGGAQTISYASPPGASSSAPLVVGSGANLTLSFWRPQRQTLATETGDFRDIAKLHYGIVISSQVQEFGCAASFYTGLNSLSPDGDQNLWPLIDTAASDSEPDVSNTLSFTLDIHGCLAANGAAVGQTFNASLTAAGAQETGGNDRAAQNFFLSVQ